MKAQCLVAPRSSSLCWSAIMVPVDESAPLVFSPCAQCGVAFGVCPRCYRGARLCGEAGRVQQRKGVRRAADTRWRETPAGRAARRAQGRRYHTRRCAQARQAEIPGDPSGPIVAPHDDGPRAQPDARVSTPEVPDVPVSEPVAVLAAPSTSPSIPCCITCGRCSWHRTTVTDHLAARERDRDAWLRARTGRRPRYAARWP